MLSTPEHSCKLCYGISADHRGSQPYYRCESPSEWLPELPWWDRNFFFFSKSLAQVGTPSRCNGAKGNKPPKNGYGGKFPLMWGGGVIKTRQMEKERGKRLFSTQSRRCLNWTHAHIQNHIGDSYLICLNQNLMQPDQVYCLFKHTATP